MEYKFNFNDIEYVLNQENFDGFFNDEENPLEGLEWEHVIELLNNFGEVSFRREYFGSCCPECRFEKGEKKVFKFLEYFFYAYSKNNKFIISSISEEYENTNYNKLYNMGEVDNSYLVRVFVCENCGVYTMEVEEFEI